MNSINIFDFMQQDEQRKREDAMALDEILAKEIQADYRTTRRDKVKPPPIDNKISKKEKSDKKFLLPEYQFFQNKETLQELLQKEEESKNLDEGEYDPLTEE